MRFYWRPGVRETIVIGRTTSHGAKMATTLADAMGIEGSTEPAAETTTPPRGRRAAAQKEPSDGPDGGSRAADARSINLPEGSRALFDYSKDPRGVGLPMDREIELVNNSLQRWHYRHTDERVKADASGRRPLISLTVVPGETFKMTVFHAHRIFSAQEKSGGDHAAIVIKQPTGDCGGAHWFVEPTFTNKPRFRLCPFSSCRTCGPHPEGFAGSLKQSMFRVKMLTTNAAIQRWTSEIDPRSAVALYAVHVMQYRDAARAARIGTSNSKTRRAVTH